jgi:pimeloyl-ACP methyl ester carboxylesterase
LDLKMPSDRNNQTIILKDGRRLGFAEFGASTTRAVFHFHGSASSRLEHPSPENMLDKMGIRFITTDRPGHGLSDYQPDRHLIDWAQDILQLADHLGILEFYVTGNSAGGPHAMACAHQLEDRIIAGALISSMAPMSRPGAFEGMPLLNQILARSARQCRGATRLIRWLMRKMVMGDAESATRQVMSSIPDSDKAALNAPQNVEILVNSIHEGFRQGALGIAEDDILVNRDWGFKLEDVKARMDIWHGMKDVNVPIHGGEFLRDSLPNVRVNFLPDAGHFFLFGCWEEILSALMDEI